MIEPTRAGRLTSRLKVTAEAICRTSTGQVFDIVLSDVSIDGCNVVTPNQKLEAGQSVAIKPDHLESLMGVVCWANKYHAGIRFAYPLYVPVLEDLVLKYGTAEAKRSIQELRDYWFGAHHMHVPRRPMPVRPV